jgi:hypothetical protein
MDLARAFLTKAALTVSPAVLLDSGVNSNHNVSAPFNHFGHCLYLIASMIQFMYKTDWQGLVPICTVDQLFYFLMTFFSPGKHSNKIMCLSCSNSVAETYRLPEVLPALRLVWEENRFCNFLCFGLAYTLYFSANPLRFSCLPMLQFEFDWIPLCKPLWHGRKGWPSLLPLPPPPFFSMLNNV